MIGDEVAVYIVVGGRKIFCECGYSVIIVIGIEVVGCTIEVGILAGDGGTFQIVCYAICVSVISCDAF